MAKPKPDKSPREKLIDLRKSGYKGPIDQDGHKAGCLVCGKTSCTRQGFAGRCS